MIYIAPAAIAAAIILAYYALILHGDVAVWRKRAKEAEAACDRKDRIMADYLRQSDELLANLAEVERYNASLERQNAELRVIPYSGGQVAAIVTHKTPEWRWN